ncbi:hypothetical protein BJ165DRAFT_1598679 [Panaeolus papilionaceus]|nr:hypothetical protein BJ165DRAFT_1598679 [Panaeolus papilionaceus]
MSHAPGDPTDENPFPPITISLIISFFGANLPSTYQKTIMSIHEYTRLKIIGDISVEPVTDKLPGDAFIYLLWGPTGAGKSCFIQALAGDSQDLGISKDQLAGVTQTAAAYKVVNVLLQDEEKDRPIYVIDTPGFSDPQISSLGVFISGEAIKRPLSIHYRHDQEFSDMGATIARFANTRDSALEILDMEPWNNDSRANIRTAMTSLYQDLHERIDGLLQRKKDIQSELADPLAQTNDELGALLEKNYTENEELLTVFVQELLSIPYLPPEYEEARYGLIKSLLASSIIPLTMSVRFFVLRYQLTGLVRHAKRRGARWFKPRD